MAHSPIDLLWVLLSAGLVFVMQAGFLCLEAGLTRTKNAIHVATKNIADFGLSVLLFWVFGFAVMFGACEWGLFGRGACAPDLGFSEAGLDNGWNAAFFLFQAMFCGTAVTIVSGAVAERVRFVGYLMMVVIVAMLYPVFGHWVWGPDGILAGKGFIDFAGSTVVHSLGGWVALAACLVIGPRLGVFKRDNDRFPGSHLPLAMLGVLLLWFGWIGFNGGSALALDGTVPGIIVNTMLAACAGLVVCMGVSYALSGYVRVTSATNGPLAGLVAITACCHCVTTAQAVAIGAIGSLIAAAVERGLEKAKVDDVIGAVPVHLAAGAWGTLCVGLFGDLSVLDTGLTRPEQVWVQLIGVAACGVLGFGVGYPLLWSAHKLIGLRVSEQAERDGLNHAEHRAKSDLYDFVDRLDKQRQSKDLSARIHVEPFTEVGMIANKFNGLMDAIEQSTTDIEHLKQTREHLEDAKAAAEKANETKTEFLANMSHEIRTPLHGILSFAGFGIKRAETVPKEKLREYFEKIDLSGQRLLTLVNDLLDLSKLEAGRMVFEFEARPLAVVVHGVVDEMASLLSECRIQVVFEDQTQGQTAEVDAVRFMQVVRNVLNNAVRYSPPNAPIQVTLTENSGQFELRIADQGPGIPKAELEAVFNKFIQSSKTKSGAGGTGLGLSICRQIMAGHHGTVHAENGAEGGAVFVIRLPHAQPKTTADDTGNAGPQEQATRESIRSRTSSDESENPSERTAA